MAAAQNESLAPANINASQGIWEHFTKTLHKVNTAHYEAICNGCAAKGLKGDKSAHHCLWNRVNMVRHLSSWCNVPSDIRRKCHFHKSDLNAKQSGFKRKISDGYSGVNSQVLELFSGGASTQSRFFTVPIADAPLAATQRREFERLLLEFTVQCAKGFD